MLSAMLERPPMTRLVAVGSGAGDELRSDQRARARTVLHHEGLPRLLAELFAQGCAPPDRSRRRGGRDDDAHRARRVVLGRRRGDAEKAARAQPARRNLELRNSTFGFHIEYRGVFRTLPVRTHHSANVTRLRAPSAPASCAQCSGRAGRDQRCPRGHHEAERGLGHRFALRAVAFIAGGGVRIDVITVVSVRRRARLPAPPIARGSSSIWVRQARGTTSSLAASKAFGRTDPGEPRGNVQAHPGNRFRIELRAALEWGNGFGEVLRDVSGQLGRKPNGGHRGRHRDGRRGR